MSAFALPAGFRAGAVACGLKPSGNPDMALIVSDRPATVAGLFTTNRVQAAPVVLTKRLVRRGTARAIVVNAGNANACTGKAGLVDAREMARLAGRAIGAREALVASTGIIGVPLSMEKVRAGIAAASAALSEDGLGAVARAIMTTDTRPKVAEASVGGARVVGIAKGAGMIAPEMATMLAFVLTDAPLERALLAPALHDATVGTFNLLSIDGCRSTNDCVLALANGATGGDPVGLEHAQAGAFREALGRVCASLARQIVEDGEGVTKVVTIRVSGAVSEREARRAARTVADSVLLRCALHGADPNWGRVMAALGTADIPFDPAVVDVWLGGEKLCERGGPGPGDTAKAAAALRERDVEVVVDLGRGTEGCALLTNDLSPEYVRINSEYST